MVDSKETQQLTAQVVEARKRMLGEQYSDTLYPVYTIQSLRKLPGKPAETQEQPISSATKSYAQYLDTSTRKSTNPFTRIWKRLR